MEACSPHIDFRSFFVVIYSYLDENCFCTSCCIPFNFSSWSNYAFHYPMSFFVIFLVIKAAAQSYQSIHFSLVCLNFKKILTLMTLHKHKCYGNIDLDRKLVKFFFKWSPCNSKAILWISCNCCIIFFIILMLVIRIVNLANTVQLRYAMKILPQTRMIKQLFRALL